jgi:hypothetical protein
MQAQEEAPSSGWSHGTLGSVLLNFISMENILRFEGRINLLINLPVC